MSANEPLATVYDPRGVEPEMYALWEREGAFRSKPDGSPHERTFTIVIPPPNVTGALHLGHALNNTLQDILVRYHRMRGFNTLWQPGLDHAGIATQAVVERRIRESEGKTRHELGREELVKRIWKWKDEYQKRIVSQLKLMGCSCDWERTRFTLDDGLAAAVRKQFFDLFKDGLIFRGKRLVNWDTQLQTAVSDDEVYHETVKGHFWHFKYPVINPKPGEPKHVVIATTRPETMLADTAVAVHPHPTAFMNRQETALREALDSASPKDRSEIKARLETALARRKSHLVALVRLRDMAEDGRKLMLPLMEREIPLITDEWADPGKGTGCVKITPAHDPNDYEVGLRHQLAMLNILTVDGKIAKIIEPNGTENSHSGDYEGLTFAKEGRKKVVAEMEARELLAEIEDHEVELGHSDRSKMPIEPFLSDQWFVRTSDIENEMLELPDGSKVPGLAQAAIDAVEDERVQIFPQRYAKSYLDWLGEKRDWCISRQLWWGHRIGVRTCTFRTDQLGGEPSNTTAIRERYEKLLHTFQEALDAFATKCGFPGAYGVCGHDTPQLECYVVTTVDAAQEQLEAIKKQEIGIDHRGYDEYRAIKELVSQWDDQDPDVLDTWFSSALWPFSTLGWPEDTDHLKQYYPGSVLCTSRDIITNWVARMVMFGLYSMGRIPFDRVYIHPKILDGRGETMSKSKGNGVDPVDIIHTQGADAMRYSLADMTTETQDIRMPVEYLCPHCGKLTEQAAALKAETQARKSRGEKLERKLQPADCHRVKCTNKDCGKEFATQWADAATKEELTLGRETSDKFEIGRNFCNKLWNAARFAFMNLEGTPCEAIDIKTLPPEDRWILARLSQTIRRYHQCLETYQFSASVRELREFFWDCLCDWYIELTKPRLAGQADGRAKQVLAFCMDQVLRLWHPTIPFMTEHLWQQLNQVVPKRGLPGIVDLAPELLLVRAAFPPIEGYPDTEDDAILTTFAELQDTTRGVRDLRTQCNVSPKEKVTVTVVVPQAHVDAFARHAHIVEHMAGAGSLTVSTHAQRPKNSAGMTVRNLRIFVHDISDDNDDRARTTAALTQLEKQIAGKQGKLGNDKFVANAKPEVVQAERTRLEELLSQRTTLEAHLAELSTA